MFSFHKPRVYRSAEGCCICRAKSSSSRFTDSTKYETDSIKCFDLKSPRKGEICNACVLLVKRFKRLPDDSQRHWGHVVDARAGPGTKSSKYKKSRDDYNSKEVDNFEDDIRSTSKQNKNTTSFLPEKIAKIFKKKRNKQTESECNTTKSSTSTSTIMDVCDHHHEDDSNKSIMPNNLSQSELSLHQTNKRFNPIIGSNRRRILPPKKFRKLVDMDSDIEYLQSNDWKAHKVCCGIIYSCTITSMKIIDADNIQLCEKHRNCRSLSDFEKEMFKRPLVDNIDEMVNNKNDDDDDDDVGDGGNGGGNDGDGGDGGSDDAVGEMIIDNKVEITNIEILKENCNTIIKNIVDEPKPVLKKHHLFYKRQSECFPSADLIIDDDDDDDDDVVVDNDLTKSTNINLKTEIAVEEEVLENLSNIPQIHSNAVNIDVIDNIVDMVDDDIVDLVIDEGNDDVNNVNDVDDDIIEMIDIDDESNVVEIFPPTTIDDISYENAIIVDKPMIIDDVNNVNEIYDDKNKPLSLVLTNNDIILPENNIVITTSPQSTPSTSPLSTPSSALTKFNDNSSDSGFDENTQERKTGDQMHRQTPEELEKILNRTEHTMFLCNGIKTHGQKQNLILTGNEIAAKILQNRQKMTQQLQQQNNITTANRLQIPSSSASKKIEQVQIGVKNQLIKPGAIFNKNLNAIEHENGVTSILPASSLAATTQIAAMNAALAPNRLFITPAPLTVKVGEPTQQTQIIKTISSNPSIINTKNLLSANATTTNNNHTHHQNILANNSNIQIVNNSNDNQNSNKIGNKIIANVSNLNSKKIIIVKPTDKFITANALNGMMFDVNGVNSANGGNGATETKRNENVPQN